MTDPRAGASPALDPQQQRCVDLEKENTVLRVMAAKAGCPYGHAPDGYCTLGYPGCACADDAMVLASTLCPQDEQRIVNRQMAELSGLRTEVARLREALQGIERNAAGFLDLTKQGHGPPTKGEMEWIVKEARAALVPSAPQTQEET